MIANHDMVTSNMSRRNTIHNDLHADAEFLSQVEAPIVELHRSNVLRLEVDELLQECRCDLSNTSHSPVSWGKAAQNYIRSLEQLLHDMNVRSSTVPCPFRSQSDKITSLELNDGHDKMPLVFAPSLFSAAHTIGLTTKSGNAQVLPTLECTLLIRKDFFQTKDYLHHRYFDKRNLLLWEVVLYLSQEKFQSSVGTVEWYYSNGNERTPCILLTPPTSADSKNATKKKKRKHQKEESSSSAARLPRKLKFRVQLSIAMESHQWIPRTRLFPNRTNLGSSSQQTPVYNCDLVMDSPTGRGLFQNATTGHFHFEWEELVSGAHSHFTDSLILLKVWCLQRGLLRGHDTFTTTTLSLLLVYLFRTKHVTPRMAPLQVFTVAMKFLAETDLLGEKTKKNKTHSSARGVSSNLLRHSPSDTRVDVASTRSMTKRTALVLPEEGLNEVQTIAQCEQARLYAEQVKHSPISDHDPSTLLQCYKEFTDGPVFLDPTMSVNYLGRVSPAYLRVVQHSARTTVQCLQTATVTRPFSFMFLSSARFWTSMDAFFRIPLEHIEFGRSELWGKDRDDMSEFESIARGLVRVLGLALGDRISSIRVLTTGNGQIKMTDSDEIPTYSARSEKDRSPTYSRQSPLGSETLVLGLKLNPDTCFRLVDRGPPADNTEATKAFVGLWGPQKAELRRFKDGAIVHAAVWTTPKPDEKYSPFEGDDKTQGCIAERVVRHILTLHFLKAKRSLPRCLLRDILSLVDGVAETSSENRILRSSALAHRNAMTAFDSLSEFLRKHSALVVSVAGSGDSKVSRLGLPLPIDAVEPLSPVLRYSELFPPVPHAHLGGTRTPGTKKLAGAIVFRPILLQIRFGLSSKWPTDLRAMGAAKTAMLIQLADGLDEMKRTGNESDDFEGPVQVTPTYMDFGYKGYSWRVVVRADPELHMLRKLQNPSSEAMSLLNLLHQEHVVRAMHHSTIHAVHTLHPSAGSVTRLSKRWVAAHMLSGLVPSEAIELLVAKVYSDGEMPLGAPTTTTSGFMRFLYLLSSHEWARYPLVVDPQGHIDEDDLSLIASQFERARGPDNRNGPPMYIVSPNDFQDEDGMKRNGQSQIETDDGGKSSKADSRVWVPTFTQNTPEWMVLKRASLLAKRSYDHLMRCLEHTGEQVDWSAVFRESSESLKSYSALLRVDPAFVVDSECSSTGTHSPLRSTQEDDTIESSYNRSMRQRSLGPPLLRRKLYRNLNMDDASSVLHGWRPIEEMVHDLRVRFGPVAVFFYNALAPEVIGILWRPSTFTPQPLSVMHSEYAIPMDGKDWKSDSLIVRNMGDLLRHMSELTNGIVVDVRILDDQSVGATRSAASRKRSSGNSEEESSASDVDE